jgi:hypothetical protein
LACEVKEKESSGVMVHTKAPAPYPMSFVFG